MRNVLTGSSFRNALLPPRSSFGMTWSVGYSWEGGAGETLVCILCILHPGAPLYNFYVFTQVICIK